MTSTISTVLSEANIGTQTRLRTHTLTQCFLLIFFCCHFHLFMLLLSISRAWIRYSTTGSNSLANQRTSLDARTFCKSVSSYALLHARMYVFISTERNGIKPILTFSHVRVYECWTTAMVYNTFCRTFLRLLYSDYLYESLKSVTLDWYARALYYYYF